MRHVTSCPGLVVSQECEEVGLEATGGEYCRQFSQQLTIQHRDNSIPVKIGTWVQGQQIQGLRGGGGGSGSGQIKNNLKIRILINNLYLDL